MKREATAEASERELITGREEHPSAVRILAPPRQAQGSAADWHLPATRARGLASGLRAFPIARNRLLVAARPRTILAQAGRAVGLELDRGLAFLLTPVGLAAGALTYFGLEREPGVLPVFAGLLLLACISLTISSRPAVRLAVSAALVCLIGFGLAKLETWRSDTKVLGAEISTRLTGKVVAIEHLANRRTRLTLDVVSTERPTLRYVPERLRVSAREVPEGMQIGAHVVGIVRLLPPSGPLRPGSYDFSFQSYFDGLGASGFYLKGPDLLSALPAPPAGERLAAFVQNGRLAIADRIRERIGGAEGEIAAALIVGVRAGIPEQVNEALRKSGLYHVISISGLHMALVAGTIIGALRLGFALLPGFSSRHPVKKYAAFAALAGTAGYLFFSGAEVAAQRSFIMLAVILAAVLFDRSALTMRNLAIAAMIILAFAPHEATGPSFQMSFAAAAALVGAYGAWSQYRETRGEADVPPNRGLAVTAIRWVILGLLGLAATSLIAGLATAIFGAWHFQRVSPLALLANLVAMPVVSVLVMPFAVMAMLAMPFGLDGPFLDIMGFGIGVMNAVAEWTAARSPVDAVGVVPASSVAFLTAALLAATVLTTWLRLVALPLALVGCGLLFTRDLPQVLVSEDGRLVGVALGDGRIAVNRARPSTFILEDWQRAMLAKTVEKPIDGPSSSPETHPFRCQDGLCVARMPSGHIVAHAEDRTTAMQACADAALIIILDPSARNPCDRRAVTVITGRDLARRGAAVITFEAQPSVGNKTAIVTYAVQAPYRPWHEHRRFSRAARGLAPYKPAQPGAKTDPAAETAYETLPGSSIQEGSARPVTRENPQ